MQINHKIKCGPQKNKLDIIIVIISNRGQVAQLFIKTPDIGTIPSSHKLHLSPHQI